MYILGQILGLIGTAVTIVTPQFRTKLQILFCNASVNTLNALSFAMLGQTGSAVYLCLVAIVQTLVSMWHDKKQTSVLIWETVLFFVLYTGFGFYGMVSSDDFVWAITMHNLLQLLPIIGAVMLMFSVFAKSEQKTRFFLLLNGASWLVYTAAIGSTVFFTSVASIVSTITALWKYRKNIKLQCGSDIKTKFINQVSSAKQSPSVMLVKEDFLYPESAHREPRTIFVPLLVVPKNETDTQSIKTCKL